ncbi:MAG TPA: hypothetical protein VII94_01120, partial [Candidatus Saccharimonadales bacterium]
MSKLAKVNKGFEVTTLAIVAAIIVILVAVSWILYENHKTTKSVTTTSKTAKSLINTTAIYAGWKTYSLPGGMSIQYPTTWTLGTSSSSYTLYSPVDNHTNLQYDLSFYQDTNSNVGSSKDVVVFSLPLGLFGKKPLYMQALDFKSVTGKDVSGLYVSNTNAKPSSLTAETNGFSLTTDTTYILIASLESKGA